MVALVIVISGKDSAAGLQYHTDKKESYSKRIGTIPINRATYALRPSQSRCSRCIKLNQRLLRRINGRCRSIVYIKWNSIVYNSNSSNQFQNRTSHAQSKAITW